MKLSITLTDEEKTSLSRFLPEGLDLSNIDVQEISVARRLLLTLRILAVRATPVENTEQRKAALANREARLAERNKRIEARKLERA